MMTFTELNKQIQKKYDDFMSVNVFWAFTNEDFKIGCEKLGASPENRLIRINGGGYMLKSKLEEFKALEKECEDMRKQFKKDMNQLKTMIKYHLSNFEYCVMQDITNTLEACSITEEEAKEPKMKKLINECVSEYMQSVGW